MKCWKCRSKLGKNPMAYSVTDRKGHTQYLCPACFRVELMFLHKEVMANDRSERNRA